MSGPLHNKTRKRLQKQVLAMQAKYLEDQVRAERVRARLFCGPYMVDYVNGKPIFGFTKHALEVAREWELMVQRFSGG